MCSARRLIVFNVCVKFHENMSSSFKVIERTRKLLTDTHTHTHTQRKDENIIPPWHTSYAGGINSNCDLELDPDPMNLKPKIVLGIVIPNIPVKLYQNWFTNRVTRVMATGEHIVRMYGTDPISPPQFRCARG